MTKKLRSLNNTLGASRDEESFRWSHLLREDQASGKFCIGDQKRRTRDFNGYGTEGCMRRIGLLAAFFIAALNSSGTAWAGSVTIKLTGVGGNKAGGVYTAPYLVSIDGATSIALISDTYKKKIDIGESWDATAIPLLEDKTLTGTQLLDYKAAALIFKSMLKGALSDNVGNFAIWGLFSKSARENPFFRSSGDAAIEKEYLALAAKAPNSAFKGLTLYIPTRGSQSPGGFPLVLMGYSLVPEPTTMALFGTGLCSLLGMARCKRSRS